MAVKVTVGLASRWPRVTDSVTYTHPQTQWPVTRRGAPCLWSSLDYGSLPYYTCLFNKLQIATKEVPQVKVTAEWRLEAPFEEISNLRILLFQVQHWLSKHLIGTVWCIHFIQLGYLYNHIATSSQLIMHGSSIVSISLSLTLTDGPVFM